MVQDLGICNNEVYLGHFLVESLFTLKFVPLNIWPILVPYDNFYLGAMVHVYAEFRCAALGVANISMKKALAIGETLAPTVFLSLSLQHAEEQNARASMVMWMKAGLRNNLQDTLGNYNNENYQVFLKSPAFLEHYRDIRMPQHYPPDAYIIENLNAYQSVAFCYYFAVNLRMYIRTLSIESIVHAYAALFKRGQVTDEFCLKVQNSVYDELGVNIQLNNATISNVYKGYMHGVNENNAQDVFMRLDTLIPDVALRLKLTLQQAAGSGLTTYIIVGRAIRKYYDFPWGRVNTLTNGELRAWEDARQIIGDNKYYGLRRDLGAVRSALYKSLGWVARELLVRLNGERTLLQYAGLTGNIKNQPALEALLDAYLAVQSKGVEVELSDIRALVPALDVLMANALFA